MSKLSNIWIFDDQSENYPELIAAAIHLGQNITAITLDESVSTKAFALGAQSVCQLTGKPENSIIEDYATTIASLINAGGKPALLILSNSRRGKAFAAKVGAQLGAGIINDVSALNLDADTLQAQHMVYGGLAIETDTITADYSVITLSSGSYAPQQEDPARTGTAQTTVYIAPPASIKCLDRKAKEGTQVDLNKAARVIGIGRGIAAQADIAQIEDLCKALGAELGCTRPIAEGEKWMDRDRYIGVSGVMLKPDIYLALGVSGQIQHMVGINSAQTIITVNKDKNAPIFKMCDYGLVGDLYKVVPALIAAFKN